MKIKRYAEIWTRNLLLYYYCITLILCIRYTTCLEKNTVHSNVELMHKEQSPFRFFKSIFNVTISENSVGRTYAAPKVPYDRIGLEIRQQCNVRYRIISGDRDKLFKAEERTVGNFAFLAIRLRTNNVILNREKTEEYLLKIKAVITCNENGYTLSYEVDGMVHVDVLDRNDLSPLFYPTFYTVTISEDIPIHRSILKVTAEDADLGINGEIYYSLSNHKDYFAIQPASGVIYCVRQLTTIKTKTLELVINANDRESLINHHNSRNSKAKVHIQIQEVNLHSPEIYVNTMSGTFSQNGYIANSIYGIIKVTDKDVDRHGRIGDVRIVDGDPDGNFQLIRTDVDGEYYLQLNKFVQLHNSTNVYNVTLRAADKGIPQRYSLKKFPIVIYVEDQHAPVFNKEIYEVSIAETSPPNMPVVRLKVMNPDVKKNALVYLEIVGGNEGEEFKINPESGMLYTQKALDAEKKSFYTITVAAIDLTNIGGNRVQSSAKVKINIIDSNDNDPIFENMETTQLLNENGLPGTYVMKVTARDNDSGENAYISYSIANFNEVPFDIDHFSGVIRTTVVIDYETMRRMYKLRVRASDWGLPFRRQTELDIFIKIVDVNDNRPQFERINCKGKILQDTPIGSDLFTLSAIDFDVGDYITYRLTAGAEDGCFLMEPTTGVLSIGCDLRDVGILRRFINVSATDGTHYSDDLTIDIELISKEHRYAPFHYMNRNDYSNFECYETGVARKLADTLATSEKNNLYTQKDFISDEYDLILNKYAHNLHQPEFYNFPFELNVNESLNLGETILQIRATDQDLGYNGKLVYAITEGDLESLFRIDPDSGELQLIGYIDRERQDKYVLNITVCDLGVPQKCDSRILFINILDSNDNTPVFQKSLISLHLLENVSNQTMVYCLNSSDADINENADATYLFAMETKFFSLAADTCCIYVNGNIDREEQTEHKLQIIAKDNGTPSLSAEALVTIWVDDVNDNAPIFGSQELLFKIREDIPIGSVVAIIEATDLDTGGANGQILFAMKNSDNNNNNTELFTIDKYSGVIRTAAYLDYETQQVHNLMVIATDCGTMPLSSTISVIIEVIDVDENRCAPEFDDFVYMARIQENQPRGTFVMNITAKDCDTEGPDSQISYSIRGGDGLGVFSVNDKGTIRTLSHLDTESKSFYWLTLCAQDHAIVSLISCIQLYINVENVNDNMPLTEKPIYYPTVAEGSPIDTKVIQLNVSDEDDSASIFHFKIISGNPEGFFKINTQGELVTTERKLDRENLAEHILEISISDNGSPALTSTTRVVVTVADINDHIPQFDQRFYKVQVPSTAVINTSIAQVQAVDNDIGDNGRISYSIKSGKGRNKFRIDADTGLVYIVKSIEPDGEYELNIRAEDHGNPKKSQTTRLNIVILPILKVSQHPPVIKTINNIVAVAENDRPGFLVTLIQVTDADNDCIWYNISTGNDRNEFYIGRENGNVLLAKYLDWEVQNFYNLTISVTDGSHIVYTNLIVNVIDTNDNRPEFSRDIYQVNISESIAEESIILQLHATDKDEDKKIFYTLHGSQDPLSLQHFRIDSITGNVIVTQRLDYEQNRRHILTAIAKDQGTPAKRNYVKIIILVYDHNDHPPQFLSKIVQRRIPESSAIGSTIVQLNAIDRDSGLNGEIKYSIISGNVGNVFDIDDTLGIVQLAHPLNMMQMQEYMLQVKATDRGQPALSSQMPIHIIVTMSENDSPKFYLQTASIEIYENLPRGTFIATIEAKSSSSVFYSIIDGNDGDHFYVNPSTGMILINSNIDYEEIKLFNLTIKGINMASASAVHNLIVHILDVNDNSPVFLQNNYNGYISEASTEGTYICQTISCKSFVFLNASDLDVGKNCLLEYTIMDEEAKKYFHIDSSTGTIKLLQSVDYESKQSFKFNVIVNDMGSPKLYSNSLATVNIQVININDCPPLFLNDGMNVTLYVPTYDGVQVVRVNAIDLDKDELTEIRYDILDGNIDDCFEINNNTGVITLRNVEKLNTFYTLHIRASDGLYSTITQIDINIKIIENTGIAFRMTRYQFSTNENTTKISTIGIVGVVGSLLFENIEYKILNPTELFAIGKTSGAIKTTGIIFDREVLDNYVLIVEATSLLYKNDIARIRRAITHIDVNIIDVNDNCPMFVNLPYYASVSREDIKGTVIIKVKAIDLDSFENGEVRYEMKKGNGELFRVDRKTGDVILNQPIEDNDKNFELIIAAYDGALIPYSTETTVSIKVVDKSMPIFSQQFYSDNIREDVELFSALSVSVQAESPLQRKLIYTITAGNEGEFFEIDYRTGVLYVVNNLDFESKPKHELLFRATDSISGVFTEVLVVVNIEDTNDCYPQIEKDNYNISVLENTLYSNEILKINASDCDVAANGALSYFIESVNGGQDNEKFYIELHDGALYLKQTLDYEICKKYHLIVIVRDHGTPSLSSRTNVWIRVENLNDNLPKFVEPSFSNKLSVEAVRGQLVTIAKAYDADDMDNFNLKYKIIDGNEHQVYAIQANTGRITLQNNQKLSNYKQTILNVSVTDGIHTTYTRVKITLLPENIHRPIFENSLYEVHIKENENPDFLLLHVKAVDKDFGKFATIFYEIVGDDMNGIFKIDKNTGAIYTNNSLDRELHAVYDFMVKATDGGGKFSYAFIKLHIDDVNDNKPIFPVNEYKITIKDDVPIDIIILKITASDADEGSNANINYTIVDDTLNSIYKKYIDMNIYGELRLINPLENISNDCIQFFARAIDNGQPALYSDVPIAIQIIPSSFDGEMPQFGKSPLHINIEESISVGLTLVKLKVVGNFTMKFDLATKTTKFSITENGEIILLQPLDREQDNIEHIVATAETVATLPILNAFIDIYFYVQDDNDNYPKFNSDVYNINIPENVEKGTFLLKVTASDIDEGPNGDVRYFIEDTSLSSLFEIDLYTGWITLLATLDREIRSEYYFNVVATDNGYPKHTSKVPVVIIVTDYNDNAPIFKQQKQQQQLEVWENALPGTVLSNFRLTDPDLHKVNLYYFIIAGDNYSQFQISNTGDLFVFQALDREFISNYNLTIAVTDGKYISIANLTITVKDINDNSPICPTPRYNITINETTIINTAILKVNAIDADENANDRLRYYLSGNRTDAFYIEKDTGIIKVATTIDREMQSKYTLYVHVQDGQELSQECISEVLIFINDINDNKPEFTMTHYIASIPEDAQLHTIVTKVHATDKDFGLNRKITYSFLENSDFFTISSSNGIVKLNRILDRENISIFNITIVAKDHGRPQLFSTANLIVHVLDINDNPPEFNMKEYNCYISEKSAINSEVTRVLATSKDIGVNAEISYYIVGGNEQMKFAIHKKTGAITTTSEIDFEKTKAFFLNVQAIDGGSPPLSSQTFVNITVLDVNDNEPQFLQNIYRARIAEDAKMGVKVLEVTATDEDSHQNGVVKYNIERGDRLKQFAIDEFTGHIYVHGKLDRETIADYVLEVRACDNGSPELCNYVAVNIHILDVNDNPPQFQNTKYSIILQENKPLDYVVFNFEISDADEIPNTYPYTYDFKSGNEGGFFRLEQDGSLRTAAKFNHRICDLYILQIRVFDNGIPPLYSDTWVTIKIIEESQYPPVITPLEITVSSYEDDFAGGFLGQIHVSDQDKYDTFDFKLVPTFGYTYSTLKLFNITQDTGKIFAIKNLDIGIYYINVTVSDGKFASHVLIHVNVEIITSEMVHNAVIIKFYDITANEFILSYRKGFIRVIRDIMRCRQKDVIIIALSQSNGQITLQTSKSLSSTNNLQNYNLTKIQSETELQSDSESHKSQSASAGADTSEVTESINDRVDNTIIRNNRNVLGEFSKILEVVFVVRKQQITPTSEAYFSSEDIWNTVSKKIEDIEYNLHLVVNKLASIECLQNNCLHGSCKQQIIIKKNQLSTYHTDVISFVTPKYKEISVCQCRPGFDGKNCDETINACASDPCPALKVCLPANSSIGYQCICPAGYTGHYCEIKSFRCLNDNCSNVLTSISFSGKSYAHYKIHKAMDANIIGKQFMFSLKVRTVQPSGTLLYASGNIDYNIIEIVNGAVQYRFDLGSGEGVVSVSSVHISDGEWHQINLERIYNSAKLMVDNKHTSQDSAPGVNVILNLQTNDIFVGAELKPHHTIIGYEDIQRGFIGCMADIKIANSALPLYISGGSTVAELKRFTNVEFSCDPSSVLIHLGICGTQPCLNSGICKELSGNSFKCICPERFAGKLCEIDSEPCASSPCLYGGLCESLGPNNYSCSCPLPMSGRRCEYGKFCTPSPCKNGGICEEGDGIPHCICKGYTGSTCEIDIDECENQPCGKGATCINEAGSFRCICPSYLTGASCGDPLYSNSISTKLRNFSLEHITGVISGITLVFLFCILTAYSLMHKKSSRHKRNGSSTRVKNSYKEIALNSLLDKEQNNKQTVKLSNLEINHRPISYTPSSTDNIFPANSNFVNNLDILRSYGSAGDELENIPLEYQKISFNNENVNINNGGNRIVDSHHPSVYHKRDRNNQIHLQTFTENKLNNENLDYNLPLNRLTQVKPNCGKLIHVAMPNISQAAYSDSSGGCGGGGCSGSGSGGGEYASLGQYHWDCSDWVRNSQNPLPDITEVPGAEIIDSSSFHSNDSNESTPCPIQNTAIKVNPVRDITTMDEELTSDCVDSELQDCFQAFHQLPLLNRGSLSRLSPFYYSENEDYKLNSDKLYLRHPDSYLPPLHNPNETDGESSTNGNRERQTSVNETAITENSEMDYLCNNKNQSCYDSTLSIHLCEIEDSEIEDFLPKSKKN